MKILEDIGPATQENWYCFTMDNLNSHTNVGFVVMIHAYGHCVVFRAPYYAVDGPIEYILNSLQTLICAQLHYVVDGNSLVAALHQSIQALVDFVPYFSHVGFFVE